MRPGDEGIEQVQRKQLDKEYFIRHKVSGDKKSKLTKYKEIVLGDVSLWKLLKYELVTTCFGPVPGALGLVLRKLFYSSLFNKVGSDIVIGQNVVLRHPGNITVGNRVFIDDYCLIDARGANGEGIVIGDDVIIGRGSQIQSKVGTIQIGSQTDIGAGSTIVAQGGILVGEMVTIAGNCMISGGAYQIERVGLSTREHEKYTKGPIRVDRKCRLGMGVIVLDGVHICEGCIVGASSLVTKDLPEYSVAAGSPAVIKRTRERTMN